MALLAGIVSFEDDTFGSASAEFRSIPVNYATKFFLYLGEVQSKQVNHRRLKPFYTYRGVECFLATYDEFITVFSVECDRDGDLKITVMFAGERGQPARCGPFLWDGWDYDALRAEVIHPRAAVWFA
jgi:hypothetical protein